MELVGSHLLDDARLGLEALGVAPDCIEEYLGIIQGRVDNRQNGATWQLAALTEAGAGSRPDTRQRREALARVLKQYLANQEAGAPVHTWSTSVE